MARCCARDRKSLPVRCLKPFFATLFTSYLLKNSLRRVASNLRLGDRLRFDHGFAATAEDEIAVAIVDRDMAPGGEGAFQQFAGKRVLDPLLNHALQRASTVRRVVAFAGNRRPGGRRDRERNLALRQLLGESYHLQIDDAANLI